jgi:signal transduction histidine kinase
MVFNRGLPAQAIVDGFGQGVLIFDQANRLVMENITAAAMLGADAKIIRAEGWKAVSALFNARLNNPDLSLDAVRAKALVSEKPIRFYAYRAGEYIPCWAAAVRGADGEVFTMLTLETPDWSALSELFERFLREVRENVETTRGHADLIQKTVKKPKANETAEQLGKRVTGFAQVIHTHMHRLGRLTAMMDRLERIRTDRLRGEVLAVRRTLPLSDYLEDWLESLSEERLLDPETEAHDYRKRLIFDIPSDILVYASPGHLSVVLRDMLRNAIMYSMIATPILIAARATEAGVQIDMIDEGYGIRSGETDRVFAPYMRSRQPQIISEFGYGLSLYLCKYEVEAMNGRLWFESEDGVGTTFSLKLPAWQAESTSMSTKNT